MSISAQIVKELRERTGAGMMECKKALIEMKGNIEHAIEHMRKTGIAKAEKKAGRIAAEGALAISVSDDAKIAALVEINCETDFVAMGDEFQNFAKQIANIVRDQEFSDVEALLLADYGDGKTIDETRKELIAKIAENMNVRRYAKINTENGCVGAYVHGTKIGVIVELDNSDTDLAKDIAMQVAAAHPLAINKEQIPQELIDREKRIYSEKAAESGKPDNIIEKMVEGSMRKYFEEVTLLGQKFIKNPDQSIEQLLKEKKANVGSFARFELGEGIEKIETDFVAEVMAQAKGQ